MTGVTDTMSGGAGRDQVDVMHSSGSQPHSGLNRSGHSSPFSEVSRRVETSFFPSGATFLTTAVHSMFSEFPSVKADEIPVLCCAPQCVRTKAFSLSRTRSLKSLWKQFCSERLSDAGLWRAGVWRAPGGICPPLAVLLL